MEANAPQPTEPTDATDADKPVEAQDQAPAAPEPTPAPATEQDLDAELQAALGDDNIESLMDQAQQQHAELEKPKGEGAADEEVHTEMRRGRITAVRGEDVFVDVQGSTGRLQGVVPLQQFDRAPRLGSIMDFVVDKVDEGQGLMFLSREGAISRTNWDNLGRGSTVEARVTGKNKGGLELELVGNIRAFMPMSQVDIHHLEDDAIEAFVGQKIPALVTEIDRKHKKVMLSRRAHLERQRKQDKTKLMATLEVGQTVEGTVSKLMPFGAFVDIGGVDGLVHVSDMSYSHVKNPGDVVKQGEKVQVKVLKIEAEKDRIALGMKQIQPDPWDAVSATVHVGEEVTGRVVRTANFGAFIQLEQGVEALLPISEISWKRIHRAEDAISVGQSLRLKVLTMDPAKQRMSLSLKQTTGDPWSQAAGKYAEDTKVTGKVVSVQDFGAFVELEEGVEGLVHISELADQRVNQVTDIVKVGEEKEFRIKSIDTDNHKISLSLRKDSGPKGGGGQGGGGRRGRDNEEMTHIQPAKKKIDQSKLKGGMDLGGIGLGGLSMDSLKKK
ncbi:S1 RNA-binding domain-containing protein [Phycisphaeraceae bacterium D3-23]